MIDYLMQRINLDLQFMFDYWWVFLILTISILFFVIVQIRKSDRQD